MSNRPKAFGLKDPTGVVRWKYGPIAAPPEGWLPSKLPCVEEREPPKKKGLEELAPPRQAYSHSASVGKRYVRPTAFSSGRADSLRQNSTASSQETCSTGWLAPPPFLRVKCD